MKTNTLDFDAQALREKILDLAMRGKLVPQDSNDKPASVLLKKIKAEKEQLIKEKKIKKSKSLAPITDDEKPFDIPDSWEWVRFGDVGLLKNGKTPKKEDISSDNIYPYFKVKDMNNNNLYMENAKNWVGEKYSRQVMPKNTIIFPKNGGAILTAKKRILTQDSLVDLNTGGLIPYNDLNHKFIFYLFLSLNIKDFVKGSAVPTINSKKLKETLVPLPPLEEQSRIAAKIAQLFALLRKVESSTQQYAKLQTLLKSKVLDLAMRGKLVEQDPNDEPASVLLEKEGLKESNEIPHQIPNSWSWIVLGSGAKFINGRAYKKSELLNDSSLTPILRVGNLFTNSSYYYSDLKLNPDKYIDNGDLIYAWSASFGPQIWTGGHVIYHYHIWKVIPKQIIEKQFLYYFLLDKRNVIGETDLHGSTMKHITKTNMEHLSFPLPPLSEQKRIVKKINFLLEIL